MQPTRLLEELDKVFAEANIQHPYFNSWWNDLKDLVTDEFPELTSMNIGTLYTMLTKKGRVIAVCTKENSKTWVLYEVDGSARPGCRWMLGKTWCIDENIERCSNQSYTLPEGVLLK